MNLTRSYINIYFKLLYFMKNIVQINFSLIIQNIYYSKCNQQNKVNELKYFPLSYYVRDYSMNPLAEENIAPGSFD